MRYKDKGVLTVLEGQELKGLLVVGKKEATVARATFTPVYICQLGHVFLDSSMTLASLILNGSSQHIRWS